MSWTLVHDAWAIHEACAAKLAEIERTLAEREAEDEGDETTC